jgi:hypothetical protein
MGRVAYLTEEESINLLHTNQEAFDRILKNKLLKKYRRGKGDTPYYRLNDLNKLTWNDIMGPIDPDGDEGAMFDMEVRTL